MYTQELTKMILQMLSKRNNNEFRLPSDNPSFRLLCLTELAYASLGGRINVLSKKIKRDRLRLQTITYLSILGFENSGCPYFNGSMINWIWPECKIGPTRIRIRTTGIFSI